MRMDSNGCQISFLKKKEDEEVWELGVKLKVKEKETLPLATTIEADADALRVVLMENL